MVRCWKRLLSILERFREGFGSQNGGQNQFFVDFFSMFFSKAFSHRFLVVFGRLRTLKICTAPRREHDFHKIDVFEKVAKKPRFWLRFRRPKLRKINKKWCLKTRVFLISIFTVFLKFLMILARFGEALGPPKIRKNP